MKLSRQRMMLMMGRRTEPIPQISWYSLDQYFSSTPISWSGIDIADIDGDGIQEVIICGRAVVNIYRVTGDLLVLAGTITPTMTNAELVLVTDIDGDGNKEILLDGYSVGAEKVETWRWDGTTATQIHIISYAGTAYNAWNMGFGNLDGSGNKIITQGYDAIKTIAIHVASSDLSASDTISFSGATSAIGWSVPKIEVADFDGDGTTEFAVSGELDGVGFIKLFTWDAVNKIVLKKTVTGSVAGKWHCAILADWNGDGVNEILVQGFETVAGVSNAFIRIYSMNFASVLATKYWNYGASTGAFGIQKCNFNGNLKPDIVVFGSEAFITDATDTQFADTWRFRNNAFTLINHFALPKGQVGHMFIEQGRLYDWDGSGFPQMVVVGWDDTTPHKSWLGLYKNYPTTPPATSSFVFTCTTTGAQTLTIQNLTAAPGRWLTINWGDGTTSTSSDAGGSKIHAYAGAGTWTVSISKRSEIAVLGLTDTKISMTINATNPMPSGLSFLRLSGESVTWTVGVSAPMPTGLTSLELASLTGITWAVGATAPMPTGLTSLILNSTAGITWTVGASAPMPIGLASLTILTEVGITWTVGTSAPMPTGLTYLFLFNCANLTWTVSATAPMPIGLTYLYIALFGGFSWTVNTTNPFPTGLTYIRLQDNLGTVSVSVEQWAVINAIQTIVYMHTLSAADVDAVLQAIWTNKANYTYSGTPVLTLTGNTAPNGTYQAASPPSTGKEYSYDLHYGTYTSAGPEWTVITA